MPGAVFVVGSIVLVWAILLGAAWHARRNAHGTSRAVAVVTFAYLVVAAGSFGWFGVDTIGALGAAGMLVPYAVALFLALS